MSGCNATITVGDETLTCTDHSDFFVGTEHGFSREGADSPAFTWGDEAPGAKPHTPPRYRAYPMHPDEDGNPDARHCGWLVQFADGDWWKEVASFPARHPDPERAARAEASRLNHREGTP